MARIVVAIVCVLAGSTPVLASPRVAAVSIGPPSWRSRIDSARLSVTPRALHTRVAVTLTFATDEALAQNVATTVTLPRGARVVGMAVTIGDGPRVPASSLWRSTARERYATLVGGRRDPALVEYEGERDGQLTVRVQVFPISRDSPGHVELEIELPAMRRLELRTAHDVPTLEVKVAGVLQPTQAPFSVPHRIALPAPSKEAIDSAELAPRPAVSPTLSLFADEPGRGSASPGPTLAVQLDAPRFPGDVATGNHELRRAVRANVRDLRGCFQVAQPSGRIDIRFAIVPSGKVSAVSVDGDGSEQIKRCITDELAKWSFPETEDVVMVSYPLVVR